MQARQGPSVCGSGQSFCKASQPGKSLMPACLYYHSTYYSCGSSMRRHDTQTHVHDIHRMCNNPLQEFYISTHTQIHNTGPTDKTKLD